MAWLQSVLNLENSTGLELVLVTLGLAIILILVFWIFRKIIGNPARRAARNRIPRLSVTDAAAVDDKRRLVLVRRDNVEHLLMIGGPSDVVIETNVMKAQPPTTTQVETTKPSEEGAVVPKAKSPEPAEPRKPLSPEPKPAPEPAATESIPAAPALAASAAVASVAASSTEDTAKKPETAEPAHEPKIAAPVEEAKPEVKTEPEEPMLEDLETTISESLDDALADIEIPQEAVNVNEGNGSSDDETAKTNNASMDDEMQRLLDELAEETKEPA